MALPPGHFGDVGVPQDPAKSSGAAEGVREAVLSGQGFAIASRWMFAPELKSDELIRLLQEWTLPPMDLWFIYPSGRLTSAKARALIKWFVKTIGRSS